ncbi:uncharacterized protein LOC113230612 [Hyposmocoma kahamanoa]|uniref:uncharacterized protein LOC113230612 n=1 Tax=Hyposmocoma kahamanoa TaxID=1477025 RepID=UPI000E6D799F|nr:uncharacterized protein LOC113230612 [Hyposmocoma kahamanoa]
MAYILLFLTFSYIFGTEACNPAAGKREGMTEILSYLKGTKNAKLVLEKLTNPRTWVTKSEGVEMNSERVPFKRDDYEKFIVDYYNRILKYESPQTEQLNMRAQEDLPESNPFNDLGNNQPIRNGAPLKCPDGDKTSAMGSI